NKFLWAGLVACVAMSQAFAGEVKVSAAWARATAPGQDVGMAAVKVTSAKDARIVAVTSTASNTAELHTMVHEKGMMKMRQVDFFEVKANQELVLGPGGNHLMLIGLKKPLKVGDTVALTMTVQFADKSKEQVEIKAEVKAMTEMYNMHMQH
ncbi:MAG: copper chaperone PCu(A)C, partial [Gallionellaceae bacterium]|nr:copper chaperone PCu(A)C [Gallionellaceae bacterium]